MVRYLFISPLLALIHNKTRLELQSRLPINPEATTHCTSGSAGFALSRAWIRIHRGDHNYDGRSTYKGGRGASTKWSQLNRKEMHRLGSMKHVFLSCTYNEVIINGVRAQKEAIFKWNRRRNVKKMEKGKTKKKKPRREIGRMNCEKKRWRANSKSRDEEKEESIKAVW